MLIHQLSERVALAARSPNIWCKDDITVTNKELYEWIPTDRVLSIQRVAEHQQGRMTGLRFRTVRFVDQSANFCTVETSVRRDVRPDEPCFASQILWHGVRELNRSAGAWRR